MGDACAGAGCRQGGAAGVGKEIQHFGRFAGAFRLPAQKQGEPVPVDGLLRKKAGVLKAEGLQAKGELLSGSFLRRRAGKILFGAGAQAVGDAPFVRQVKKLPFAAAPGASVIMSVFVFPALMAAGSVPDDLGIRSYQNIIAPSFQFFTA